MDRLTSSRHVLLPTVALLLAVGGGAAVSGGTALADVLWGVAIVVVAVELAITTISRLCEGRIAIVLLALLGLLGALALGELLAGAAISLLVVSGEALDQHLPRLWAWSRRIGAALLGLTVVAVAVISVVRWDFVVATWTHRVGAPDQTWDVVALPKESQPWLRVALVGDVGDGGGEEYETAGAIEAQSHVDPFDILMLLGDNVYPAGDPSRIEATVFEPFGPLLDAGTELFAVLGNHDAMSDTEDAQMAALGMPGRWYAVERGDLLGIALDTTRPDDPDQLAWLEETLASSDATWKLVGLHHPPYSSGFQGSSEHLRGTFVPLFERYGVQVVFSGHEHDYQRSEPINGVTYIVTGAASRTRRTSIADFTAVAYSTHSFVDLNVFDDHLLLRAIDHDGGQFDEVVIPARPVASG